MFNNWLVCRALAEELDRRLQGAVICEIFTQEKDELILLLQGAGDAFALQYSARPSLLFLAPLRKFARAGKNSIDLFRSCRGRKVAAVRAATDDRIVSLTLDNGDVMLFVMFARNAGVALRNSEGMPVESYKRAGAMPRVVFDNTLPRLTMTDVLQHLESPPGETLASALARVRPFLRGAVATETLYRCRLSPDTRIGAIEPAQREDIARCLIELLQEASLGPPRIYHLAGSPAVLSLITMRHLENRECIEFDNLGDCIFTVTRKRLSLEATDSIKKRLLESINREQERLNRAAERLSPPEVIERRAAEYEKFANLLMINMHCLPEQPGRITLPDIFVDPRIVISVPLRENESLLGNAQRYYDKARNARASVAHVAERMAYLRERSGIFSRLREAIEEADSATALKDIIKTHEALFKSMGLTSKGEIDHKPFPFRRFTVSGGFEVWAGKNSANNDELTTRHARPGDLWFHARGAGGSHVVLRSHGSPAPVPKEAIRAAASIAAYYSKHRNAKSVSVAYAERKYVRKPKGAAPGTVYMEREKVITVEPRLPDSTEQTGRSAASNDA